MGTIVRRLDANHDMTFGRGMQDIATGGESTQQRVSCRLMVMLGEWFLDLDDGMPWFQPTGTGVKPIMGGGPDSLAYAEAWAKRRILETDGVEEILRFDL